LANSSPVRRISTIGVMALAIGVGTIRPGDATPRQTDTTTSAPQTPQILTKTVALREPIPYPTLRKPTSLLRSGTSRILRGGVKGEKEVTYRIWLRPNGTEMKRTLLSERILKKPVPEVVQVGIAARLASRGYFSGRRVLIMNATYYYPHEGSATGRASTGIKCGYGVVAVDPHYIPLGTRLYIEGYGYAIAADIGSAIKGNRIDLCIDSLHNIAHIRDMHHVRVHILN